MEIKSKHFRNRGKHLATRMRLWGGLLVVCWISWASAAGGQATGAADLLREIAAGMATVRSLEADFVQTKQLALFDETLEISGRLYLQHPDRFAWRVANPLHYHLVMDGAVLAQWDEDTKRVVATDLAGNPVFAEMVGQITGWFFGAYDRMTEEYKVVVTGHDPPGLRFIPLPETGAAAFVRELEIHFQPDLRYIRDIAITESGGDLTRITFSNTVINSSIPEMVWKAGTGDR